MSSPCLEVPSAERSPSADRDVNAAVHPLKDWQPAPDMAMEMHSPVTSAAFHGGTVDRDAGFTLIELLVVMIIISILMAVAIPVYTGQKAKARATNTKEQITHTWKAIESCSAGLQSGTFYEINDDGTTTNCATGAAVKAEDKGIGSKVSVLPDGLTPDQWVNVPSMLTRDQVAILSSVPDDLLIVGSIVPETDPMVVMVQFQVATGGAIDRSTLIGSVVDGTIPDGAPFKVCGSDFSKPYSEQPDNAKSICPTGRW